MFTRIVELTTKPGKNEQLSATINDKILSILKKQKGFVDEMVLVSDKEDNRVLALSFWNTREDAEQYHRSEFPKVQETVRPLLDDAQVPLPPPLVEPQSVVAEEGALPAGPDPPADVSALRPLPFRRQEHALCVT